MRSICKLRIRKLRISECKSLGNPDMDPQTPPRKSLSPKGGSACKPTAPSVAQAVATAWASRLGAEDCTHRVTQGERASHRRTPLKVPGKIHQEGDSPLEDAADKVNICWKMPLNIHWRRMHRCLSLWKTVHPDGKQVDSSTRQNMRTPR